MGIAFETLKESVCSAHAIAFHELASKMVYFVAPGNGWRAPGDSEGWPSGDRKCRDDGRLMYLRWFRHNGNCMLEQDDERHKVLGSSSAVRVLKELYGGSKSASEVARSLSVTIPAARYTLDALKAAGLVVSSQIRIGKHQPVEYYRTTNELALSLWPASRIQDTSDRLMIGFKEALGDEKFAEIVMEIGRKTGVDYMKDMIAHGSGKELTLSEFCALSQKGIGGDKVATMTEARKEGVFIQRIYECPAKGYTGDKALATCDLLERGIMKGGSEATGGRFKIERTARADANTPYCEFVYSKV
jgi:DNA-binding transcriptional ArsR family regulator